MYGPRVRRRGYLKLHISVDIKRRIVSLKVTVERVKDSRMLKPLVDEALERCRVVRVLGDGGYDTRANFNYLDERKVDPGIRVRSNSVAKSMGSPARRKAVVEQMDYRRWLDKGYGYRWIAESAISSIKRTFGEYFTSRRWDNIVREMEWKTYMYNRFMEMLPPPNP